MISAVVPRDEAGPSEGAMPLGLIETNAPAAGPIIVSREASLMGGRVAVHIHPGAAPLAANRDGDLVLRRLGAWADRLTRFRTTSDLMRLNADPRAAVPIRPTLAAVLDWGRAAESATDSIVNVAMLDHRLAAEATPDAAVGALRSGGRVDSNRPVGASDSWSMDRGARTTWVRRPNGLHFDLDGVAKGWLADRALALLGRYPAAVIDADGDIALRLAPGESWWIGVADPNRPERDLATLRLTGTSSILSTTFGMATSGTSVHRWGRGGPLRHHLIDPRTGFPAETDIVQATVIAGSARTAEAWAKAAVILGSADALAALDRPGVKGAILVTDAGDLLMPPSTMRYLA
jgi:thiamine biosynthesis lipoprotein